MTNCGHFAFVPELKTVSAFLMLVRNAESCFLCLVLVLLPCGGKV